MRSGFASIAFLALASAATLGVAADPPEDVGSTLTTIATLRESGDMEGAAKRASDLVTQHPESVEAHLAFQDIELALGREKQVTLTYKNAARAPSAGADAHYLYARLLRGAPAVAEFRAALKSDPRHFGALCGLGFELTHARSFAEAKNALDDASRARPKSAVPVNALGRLEEARGASAEAERLYRRAIELDPRMTLARVNLGILLVGLDRRDDALKVLEEAAKLAPKDALPHLGIGMLHMRAKERSLAVASFQKAVDLDDDNVTSLNLLANACTSLSQFDVAEKALLRALTIAPQSLSSRVAMAFLQIAKGEIDAASKSAAAALHIDDGSAEAHYVMGLVHDYQRNPRKAQSEFQKAQRLEPENPVFVKAIAALAASQGEWRTAISESQRLVKLTGGSADAMMRLAAAYVGAEKPKLAASTLEQILAAEPARLDAWLQLGIVRHRDLRDLKKAVKAYREYQNRGGTDPRVAKWIAQIEN